MKLKTNNKFSIWLYKLACKFGYNYLPIKTVYITPKNLIKLFCVIKVPKSEYIGAIKDYTNQLIYRKFVENEEFKQNIKITSRYNPADCTEIINAELYILNKEGLEELYERH